MTESPGIWSPLRISAGSFDTLPAADTGKAPRLLNISYAVFYSGESESDIPFPGSTCEKGPLKTYLPGLITLSVFPELRLLRIMQS